MSSINRVLRNLAAQKEQQHQQQSSSSSLHHTNTSHTHHHSQSKSAAKNKNEITNIQLKIKKMNKMNWHNSSYFISAEFLVFSLHFPFVSFFFVSCIFSFACSLWKIIVWAKDMQLTQIQTFYSQKKQELYEYIFSCKKIRCLFVSIKLKTFRNDFNNKRKMKSEMKIDVRVLELLTFFCCCCSFAASVHQQSPIIDRVAASTPPTLSNLSSDSAYDKFRLLNGHHVSLSPPYRQFYFSFTSYILFSHWKWINLKWINDKNHFNVASSFDIATSFGRKW